MFFSSFLTLFTLFGALSWREKLPAAGTKGRVAERPRFHSQRHGKNLLLCIESTQSQMRPSPQFPSAAAQSI